MKTLDFSFNGPNFSAVAAAEKVAVEGDGDGYVTFDDGAGKMPIENLVVNIEAVQAGSGEPSASNIRDIYGRTKAGVYRRGKNLFQSVFQRASSTSTSWSSVPINLNKYMFPLRLSGLNSEYNSYSLAYDKSGNYVGRTTSASRSAQTISAATNFSVDSAANHNYDTIAYFTLRYYNSGISNQTEANTEFANRDNQAELGSSTTTFEAFDGDSVEYDWSDTVGAVYGGTLNVNTGELTVTHGYIASYNGETLSGEWISDRDVYAAGTTPTTGAEVVYELDEADYVTYWVGSATLTTGEGTNNIFADCGTIDSLTYYQQPSDGSVVVMDKSGFMVAARDYDRIVVPGRNGELTLDNGRWENIDGSYECGIAKDYGTRKLALQRWLAALGGGYGKLTDTEETDTFRLARFKSIKEKRILADVGAVLEIAFDCMPQRFLNSGAEAQSVASGGVLFNPTDQTAEPLIVVTGSGNGTLTVNGTAYTISSIATSVTLDCETKRAYSGTTPKDSTVSGYPVLNPGANTISYSGGITAVSITPRWWQL